jgi:hypothetical protein
MYFRTMSTNMISVSRPSIAPLPGRPEVASSIVNATVVPSHVLGSFGTLPPLAADRVDRLDSGVIGRAADNENFGQRIKERREPLVAVQISADEPRPSAATTQRYLRYRIGCRPREYVLETGRDGVRTVAHCVRVAVGEDHDITGVHREGSAAQAFDEAFTFNEDVKEADVLRVRHHDRGKQLRVRRRDCPGRREFRREEHRAAQAHRPENI